MSGKVAVVLYAILALAASEIEQSDDVSVVKGHAVVCPGDTPPPSPIKCVTSCAGLSDGDYQSCTSCHKYVTCTNGIPYKDRPCGPFLVWNDKDKSCTLESATCPSGGFYMNLEDSDLGEAYVDDTTWQMLPGVPERNIAAPTATGACDTAVLYKFTPPACIKTLRFQITTSASSDLYAYGVADAYNISLTESRCTIIGSDLDNYFQYVDFDHSASYVELIHEQVSTPLCAQITPGVVTLLSSEGVVYTITGDKFFKRMGAAPFVFAVNVDLHTMSPHPGGVCSLKVDWSC